jgi:DNA-binding NtrC family response regulator
MLAAGQRPTLLASDIDRLAPDLQIRLATALAAVPISPRFLATAQTPLGELVGQGHFRHDLACRLATLTIHLPALVDRIDDLPLLAQALVEEVNAQGDKQLAGFDPAALDELFLYTWPRNVAELREVVLAAHARAEGPHITSADLPDWFRHVADAQGRPQVEPEPIMLDEFLAGIELELIERALAQAKGNKTRAAELLGLNRPRFYRRLVQLGLIDASDSDA